VEKAPHPLDDPCPAFLSLLDSDPEQALRQFAEFAYRLLSARPPMVLGALPRSRREDAIQEVLLAIASRPDLLRRYTPRPGVPFAAWLQVVAHNRVVDWLRNEGRATLGRPVDPEALDRIPGVRQAASPLMPRVLHCMQLLSPKCRTLIEMHTLGYEPREIAKLGPRLLGLEAYSNRQASDDLRYCVHCLQQLARENGVTSSSPWTDP
jgi:DNA-directed RNA polymerase specialized sigma24 family protein